MELPQIGANCSYAGCADLDFLPITCDYCRKMFCSVKDENYVPVTKYTKPARTAAPARKKQSVRVAPKIELMKLKAKATGNQNMAMEDRLYLSVASATKTIVVFINKVGATASEITHYPYSAYAVGSIWDSITVNVVE
ncbi:hypothetical protein FBU59_000271 [Linderina macrospora]|uniref:Uncharacterized protein n=1 Tax=Linderina macrospora TaxID=4868 RepID=A0ACC1JH56_9FUNG|nr:hypothetical protein FBU59_000271 [Linderina macrospora]